MILTDKELELIEGSVRKTLLHAQDMTEYCQKHESHREALPLFAEVETLAARLLDKIIAHRQEQLADPFIPVGG